MVCKVTNQPTNNIYTRATARLHVDNQVSETIPILTGVRQGDPVFPKLFTATIQGVFNNVQLEEKGTNIDGKTIGPRFEDNVGLTTEGVKDMEHQSNVNEDSLRICLKLQKGNSRNQIYDKHWHNIQHPNGRTGLETVTNYKYVTNNRNGNRTRQEVSITLKLGRSGVFLFFVFVFFLNAEKSSWTGTFP